MSIELDHLILAVNDRQQSIDFYAGVLGLAYEDEQEPFSMLRVSANLVLQLAPWGTPGGQHLAFALPRAEFEEVFQRVQDGGVAYGDSFHEVGNMRGPGEELGSRGMGPTVYFFDPSAHLIEIRCYD